MQNFEIGINLRVTESSNQGMRAYMEDFATYYFEKCPDKPESDRIKFAYFAVFDGHGGAEAAKFAKAHLLNEIKKVDGFWSTDDNLVLEAIRKGFINTHKAMWNERGKWAKTARGLDSTAGTTASIAIVRNRKLYTGHVGDSAIVLGCRDPREQSRDLWHAQALTVEHKPSNPKERERIERAGGSLMRKGGVYRVVWRRPAAPPADTDSPQQEQLEAFESVPFLAVARSLGDLWSYDKNSAEFHVSPEPDVQCIQLDYTKHKCLILGSDGLWNMVAPDSAVEMVHVCERATENKVFTDPDVPQNFFYNPSGSLVQMAMQRWMRAELRADNVTALVVMLDPPGRPMSQLRNEQRDLTLARLGLQRESPTLIVEGEQEQQQQRQQQHQPLRLQDLLVHCEKWQNANRPGTNSHGHTKQQPQQPPGNSQQMNEDAQSGNGKLTGQATIAGSSSKLKRPAGSDRTLFSPTFKRSPAAATVAAAAASEGSGTPAGVSFYLPPTPELDNPSSSSKSVAARRQTRSATTATVDSEQKQLQQINTPKQQASVKDASSSAASAASAVKRRRLSMGSSVPGAGSGGGGGSSVAASAVVSCLNRLRRRKSTR